MRAAGIEKVQNLDDAAYATRDIAGLASHAQHKRVRALLKHSLTMPQYTPEGVEPVAEQEAQQREAAYYAEQEAISLQQEAEDNEYDATVAAFEAAILEPPNATSQSEMSLKDALIAAGYTQQEINDQTINTTDAEQQGQTSVIDTRAKSAQLEAGQSVAKTTPRDGAPSDSGRESPPSGNIRSRSQSEATADDTVTAGNASRHVFGFKKTIESKDQPKG